MEQKKILMDLVFKSDEIINRRKKALQGMSTFGKLKQAIMNIGYQLYYNWWGYYFNKKNYKAYTMASRAVKIRNNMCY